MREQRTALNKPAVVDTPLGKMEGGGSVEAGYVPQAYVKVGLGEQLASALNVGMKAATTFAEGKNKETRRLRAIRQADAGTADANKILSELQKKVVDIPPYEIGPNGEKINSRRKFLEKELQKHANSLAERGGEIHSAYYEAMLKKLGSGAEAIAAGTDKNLLDNYLQDGKNKRLGSLKSQFDAGEMSAQDMIDDQYASGWYNTRVEATDDYFAVAGAWIKEKAQTDPTYNFNDDITRLMRVKSKDGVIDFSTDPRYGKMIDTLESEIKTIRSAQYTAHKNAIAQGRDDSDRALTSFFIKSDIEGARAHLEANAKYYKVDEYKKQEELINGMATRVFAQGVSDTDTYLKLHQDIATGRFNLADLEANASKLTQTDYNKLVEAQSSFTEGMQKSSAANANSMFSKLLTSGQGNASGVSMFDLAGAQAGKQKKQFYTQEMLQRQEAFVEEFGWGALTVSQVREWDREVMTYIKANEAMFTGENVITAQGAVTVQQAPAPAPVEPPKPTAQVPQISFEKFVNESSIYIANARQAEVPYEDFIKFMANATLSDEATIRSNIPESLYNGGN